jgi:hypothetical protein
MRGSRSVLRRLNYKTLRNSSYENYSAALSKLSTEENEANECFLEGGALRRHSQSERFGLAGNRPSIHATLRFLRYLLFYSCWFFARLRIEHMPNAG